MPNEVKLLPCPTPWCDGKGGEPYVFERRRDILGVYCPTCSVSTPYFPTQEQAIECWQSRPTIVTDEVVERVALAIAQEIGWGTFSHFNPDDMRRVARAALAAMPAIVGGEVGNNEQG